MKNSTLIFRSLAVIVFLTGIAHMASYASPKKEVMQPIEIIDSISLEGKWKVNYATEDFKGAIIYSIKKEDQSLHAYTYQYQDESGATEKAEGTKTLTIQNFDGSQGNGIYTIEYEKKSYEVDCKITMTDSNTFELSYDYYGYSDVEIWKRQ